MMDYYMKANIIFCLFSLATASPPSQQDFGFCSQIYTMHQYCTSQMSPASTGVAHRLGSQPRVGKAGPRGPPGRVNYTAIGEKIAAKYLDLEARNDESFERLEGSIKTRLESGDAVIERVRNETADSSKSIKGFQKDMEARIDEKIEEIRNETRKGINEYRKDLETRNDENFEQLGVIIGARLESSDAVIERIRNETAENSKSIKENQKDLEIRIEEKIERFKSMVNEQLERSNVKIEEIRNETEKGINGNRKDFEARIDERIERLKGIVVAWLERGDTEIEKLQNKTTKNTKCIKETRKRTPIWPAGTIWSSCDDVPRSNCESRERKGGIFNISRDATLYEVYCDMTTDEGGWTVFQRRMDGSVDFYRDWEEYARGFGNKSGEFWLGLEAVHQLTQDGAYELRVDLTDWDGRTAYAKYGTFSISGRSDNYRLTIGEYSGTAGDSLHYHNNFPFSAKNKDLDGWFYNCATDLQAAWWFKSCGIAILNGRYNDTSGYYRGVFWFHWKLKYRYSLKASEMKFREK